MKKVLKHKPTPQETILEKVKNNFRSLLLGLISVVILIMLVVKTVPLVQQVIDNTTTQQQSNKLAKEQESKRAAEIANKKKQDIVYVVKEGDNLWSIAEEKYGDGEKAFEIATKNKIEQADFIDVGQQIVLPQVTIAAQNKEQGQITETAASTRNSKINQTTYEIKEGDHLWKIAEDIYGNGEMWTHIAQANNLTEPSLIHVGNVLKIPPLDPIPTRDISK